MNDVIRSAAEIIAGYNAALASAWLSRPFARRQLAEAFIRGFLTSDSADAPAAAWWVLKVAMLEQRYRGLAG